MIVLRPGARCLALVQGDGRVAAVPFFKVLQFDILANIW